MKIIDELGQEITDPDLSLGYIMQTTRIKPDAVPVDGIHKFALLPEDYEEVQVYIQWTDVQIENQIQAAYAAELEAQKEAFLTAGPQQIEDIMNAIAELGAIVCE